MTIFGHRLCVCQVLECANFVRLFVRLFSRAFFQLAHFATHSYLGSARVHTREYKYNKFTAIQDWNQD